MAKEQIRPRAILSLNLHYILILRTMLTLKLKNILINFNHLTDFLKSKRN